MSPTLARRFPGRSRGRHPYPLVPPLPELSEITLGPPPFRGNRTIAESAATARRTLSSSPRSSGTVTLRRVGSACRAAEYWASGSGCERTLSATTRPPGSTLSAREAEELFVVVLLGVEEDDVEHVVDPRQLLERVALAQLGPLLDARLLDVAMPGLDLAPGRARARGRARRGTGRPPRARSRSSRASRRARAPRSRSAARRARRGSGRSSARPGASAARAGARAPARRRPHVRGARARPLRGRRASAGNYRGTGARRADDRDRADAGGRLLLPHRRLEPADLAGRREERDPARRADRGVALAARQASCTRRSRSSSRRSRACSRCERSTVRCPSPSGTSSSRPTAGRGSR